jgi:hypothetical protein
LSTGQAKTYFASLCLKRGLYKCWNMGW